MKRYAASIQYGAGWHYFDHYFDTKEEALTYAKAWIGRRGKRKGAKSSVHLWYLLDTFRKE